MNVPLSQRRAITAMYALALLAAAVLFRLAYLERPTWLSEDGREVFCFAFAAVFGALWTLSVRWLRDFRRRRGAR